jgi:eukaryotic-like serine/threonine-protein kinase
MPRDLDGTRVALANRYRLDAPIARGGMGTVWRAEDTLLRRPVAVKEIAVPPSPSGEEDAVRMRVMREAQAAARLSHPRTVTVYDVVEQDDRIWLVMELVDAGSLADLVEAGGPLPPQRAAAVGLGLVSALQEAHRSGIVHRDVKPGNVLVAHDGSIKLTDFGIASLRDDPRITRTGMVLGSPSYMAPEQARGEPPGPAVDVWGLGATLWYAVEGASPYSRDSAIATLGAIVNEPIPAPTRAGPLAPALGRLLAKEPQDRPSLEEAARLLEAVLANGAVGGSAPRASTAEQVATPLATIAAAAAPTELASPTAAAATDLAPPTAAVPTGLAPPAAAADLAPPAPTELAPPTQLAPPTDLAPPAPRVRDSRVVRRVPPPRHRRSSSSGWGWAVALLVVILLIAGGLLAASALRDDDGDGGTAASSSTTATTAAPAGSSTTAAPTTATTAAPTTETTAAASSTTTATSAPPSTSTPTTAAPQPAPGVPDGWESYTDPATGFVLAHPPGWEMSQDAANRVRFRDPSNGDSVLVEWTDEPGPSALGAWEEQAQNFPRTHEGYHEIRLEEVEYKGFDAAIWEFTWVDDGTTLHATDLGMVTGNYGFALFSVAADSRWSEASATFDTMADAFDPPT